jgi:tRNA-dihydrouridine synthase
MLWSELGLALAPMEGISDAIVRDLLSGLGGMDLCVTEFIRVTREPVSRKVLLREAPELEAVPRRVQLHHAERTSATSRLRPSRPNV